MLPLGPLITACYASAWASLKLLDPSGKRQDILQALKETDNFMSAISETQDFERRDLARTLRRLPVKKDQRQEAWSFTIGRWLGYHCGQPNPSFEEALDLGWAIASFGLGYWENGSLSYRDSGTVRKLVLPYSPADALEILGPTNFPNQDGSIPSLKKLSLASTTTDKSVDRPVIWDLEPTLGAASSVEVTRVGFEHKQFADDRLPEWIDALEVCYHGDGQAILETLWDRLGAERSIIFYHSEEQKDMIEKAWQAWSKKNHLFESRTTPLLTPAKWFDPAKETEQKTALRKMRQMSKAFGEQDLENNSLATKINAFAAGFGTDSEVVLTCARYGLDDATTHALRATRYITGHCIFC